MNENCCADLDNEVFLKGGVRKKAFFENITTKKYESKILDIKNYEQVHFEKWNHSQVFFTDIAHSFTTNVSLRKTDNLSFFSKIPLIA